MKTSDLIKFIYESLDKRKAEDIIVLDIKGLSSIADYFIVASSNSERGVKSLSENLLKDMKKELKMKVKIDGVNDKRWIVIDTGDVIIHVFHSETRKIYDIESLWYEAKKINAL